MATSESDDFESADEEMNYDRPTKRNIQSQKWCSPTTIGSESDDDTEFVPRAPYTTNIVYNTNRERYGRKRGMITGDKKSDKDTVIKSNDGSDNCTNYCEKDEQVIAKTEETAKEVSKEVTFSNLQKEKCPQENTSPVDLTMEENNKVTSFDKNGAQVHSEEKLDMKIPCTSKSDESIRCKKKVGVKKLGTKIIANTDDITTNIVKGNVSSEEEKISVNQSLLSNEFNESEMPEEMKSDKKFKEVFKPEGWEGLGNEIELPEELTEEKLQPILKKLSSAGQVSENSSDGWAWGNWDVSSLINTATAGVSTLTSHVSHGLTLLEESIILPEEPTSTKKEGEESPTSNDNKTEQSEETPTRSSFGFENLMSGVSSITKLVESTGNRVMTGGLGTLEAIGKKTMEVLQEGDPGLKKKRAFFAIEAEKPSLSLVLREAKEKADTVEKTIEEKKKMRKVHFESLFDDYQGLVHLEALEMLSKQSHIKIQQHLIGLNTSELQSVQETLEEVMELCDLGDDDDIHKKDLKLTLQEACNDLGINISYEKLYLICEDSEAYLTPPVIHIDEEIFEHAISLMAQFTAFSVERFHKTAELLLIKEHRSTVNEADALVHLTHILSKQIGVLADTYCKSLNEVDKVSGDADSVNTYITTIFMEASNASSYIQDAFKLLIPIIQAGVI